MSERKAQLVAEAVSVLCPHCEECQPNKDGSEMWTREDFDRLDGASSECVSCGGSLKITPGPARFV